MLTNAARRRSPVPALALAALLVAAPAVSRPARAQSARRRTAVLRLDFDAKISEGSRDQLAQQLVESLASVGFLVFAAEAPVKEMMRARPELTTCESPTCYQQIAATLGADFLVVGRVDLKQKNYDIGLTLISARTGQKAAEARDRCELCGIREADEVMGNVAVRLRSGMQQVDAPARVAVTGAPAGALVVLDGRPVGFLPCSVETREGPHEVVVSMAGFESRRTGLELRAGVEQPLAVDLAATPRPHHSRGPWRAIGWTGVLVGAVATGLGIWSLARVDCVRDRSAMDGKVTCEGNPRTSWAAASALLGVGGLGLGIGSVAFFAAAAPGTATAPADAPPATSATTSFWLGTRGRF